MCRRDTQTCFPKCTSTAHYLRRGVFQSVVCQQDYGKNNAAPIYGERRKREEPVTFWRSESHVDYMNFLFTLNNSRQVIWSCGNDKTDVNLYNTHLVSCTNQQTNWLFLGCLAGFLVGWLDVWLTCWLVGLMICWLVGLFVSRMHKTYQTHFPQNLAGECVSAPNRPH